MRTGVSAGWIGGVLMGVGATSVVVGLVAMTDPTRESERPEVQTVPPRQVPLTLEEIARIEPALARIDWLVGEWDGTGDLKTTPGRTDPAYAAWSGPWHVTRSFEGRYLRLEFSARVSPGASGEAARDIRYVGYITYDPRRERYRSVWLNPDRNETFRESGSIDEAGVLTMMRSQRDLPPGATEVRSVYSRPAGGGIRVQDDEYDPDAREWTRSFRFDLTPRR